MRVTGKLLIGTVLAIISVLGAESWYALRQGDDLKTVDVAHEERMARALQVTVNRVWQTEGEEVARRVVEAVNEGTPHVGIRWVAPDHMPGSLGEELRAAQVRGTFVRLMRTDDAGEEMRYTYVPIGNDGSAKGALELVETMAPRQAFVRRAQMQQGVAGVVLVVLSGLVALALGTRLVERPVQQLRQYVRALGAGTPPPQIALQRADEIGGLAQELHLMSERLAQRERLQHADRLRTVGQLASGIAHELGTPLNVIALRARLISSGEATGAEAVTNAGVIAEQAGRMTAIIRQVLDYSRREGVALAVLDFRHVVARTIELVDAFARKQGATMEVQTADQPLRVRASETKLQQVLTNIVLNGLQAMGTRGRLLVEVGACAAVPPAGHGGAAGPHCCVVVTDDGPGIEPDDLPHLFEPFFTTKSVGEGTGLGLAVAQAIVEEHGGWIIAENAPGHGARFAIYLPRVEAAQSAA